MSSTPPTSTASPLPTTAAAPRTPPPPELSVKVTLPTPSSFSARRNRSQSIDQASPPPPSSDTSSTKSMGHTRSVSFSIESPECPSDNGSYDQVEDVGDGPKLYKIPQRSQLSPVGYLSTPSSNTFTSPPSSLRRLNTPKPLNLSRPISSGRLSALSPSVRGPMTAPGPGSRFSSTAASRGISIAPALARGARHSISGGKGSIWSAGLDGALLGSGWISPALNSAKSTGTAARQRGLTVAVLKDGKEMIVGDVPVTPGLSTGGGLRSAGLIGSAPFKGSPIIEEKEDGLDKSPSLSSPRKQDVIILCRYYHTPGLSCTSRPCRFVHNLEAISSPKPIDEYEMKSPNADPTGGTFAEAQMKAQAKILKVDDLVANGATPGETVVLSDEGGKEVRGTVYLMSGGGKGPAGKSRAKFKTVKCKDYAEGYCVYGEYCSFIHEEKSTETKVEHANGNKPDTTANANTTETENVAPDDKPATQAKPAKKLDAWTKALPRAVLVPSVAIDTSALEKQRNRLSAFAPPYSNTPMMVDEKGQLVPEPEPRNEEPIGATTLFKPKTAAARTSVWAKGLPLSLKKVTIADTSSEPSQSSSMLAPPASAFSMFGTESDPATPWDPALMSRMMEEDNYNYDYDSSIVTPPSPYPSPPFAEQQQQWAAMAYPWGMPMSPSSPLDRNDPLAGIPGGPGVMWTPAGWAVQDAAMKLSLRAAEMKAKNDKAKVRGKSYYKTKVCKYFSEGECPHGDQCTYLHDENAPPTIAKPFKAKTLPCKFFNSTKGCVNGEDCDFLHQFVVPPSVPLVEKPRPWRTRPCRHWQLGRCTLGDACHFAHVRDPTHRVLVVESEKACRHWEATGMCSKGFECKFRHGYADSGQGYNGGLADAFREMKMRRGSHEESDGEDDDVEIVTATHTSFSPAQSIRC